MIQVATIAKPVRATGAYIKHVGVHLYKTATYVRARAFEKSSLGGYIAAIGGGQAFNKPWSYVAITIGIIMIFVPDPPKCNHDD